MESPAEETRETKPNQSLAPRWRPLSATQRRIVGVLVEKSKTTPDGYPLSLNGLVTGCNQKSNRDPQMDLQPHQVEDALEQLRGLGAVAEVFGGGRVAKYRHYMYDWLGVDSNELGVMCELLLRGSQTVGDLRARAARMAKIAGIEELRPILQSLRDKNLVVFLTPEGRGQVVTHNLYLPEELERQKKKYAQGWVDDSASPAPPASARTPPPVAASSAPVASAHVAQPRGGEAPGGASDGDASSVAQLRQELAALRDEVARLKREVEDIWANLR